MPSVVIAGHHPATRARLTGQGFGRRAVVLHISHFLEPWLVPSREHDLGRKGVDTPSGPAFVATVVTGSISGVGWGRRAHMAPSVSLGRFGVRKGIPALWFWMPSRPHWVPAVKFSFTFYFLKKQNQCLFFFFYWNRVLSPNSGQSLPGSEGLSCATTGRVSFGAASPGPPS